MRGPDFLTLQSIFKGSVDMNRTSLEKCKMRVLFMNFKFKINLNMSLDFSSLILVFQTLSEMSIKEIRVRYVQLMALKSMFKGTVDMNQNS